MRYSASVSALALATAVLAQDQTVIHVGNDGNGTKELMFTPSSVAASNGTVITFVFDTPNTNHTVAQSTFANPCEPIQNGFDSGYTPGPANAGDPPATWNLTITDDTKPIWFYCAQQAAQPFHCTAGMVGAINAPASPAPNDFDAFVSAATGASTIVQPTSALTGVGAFATVAPTIFVSTTATDSASASDSTSATDSSTDSGASSPSSTSDSAPPASNTPATTPAGTASANGAATTVMTTSTITGSAASTTSATSNAAVAGAGAGSIGKNGLVWAVAAVFGVALL